MVIRFRFCKKDEFKYLSHLDILNLLSRGVCRAGLKAVFSCGFNPKPRITLSNPIPLGVESVAEYADIELDSEIGSEDFINKMNASLPELLEVLDAVKTDQKIKNLMSVIDIVLYEFLIEAPGKMDAGFIGSFIDIYEKQGFLKNCTESNTEDVGTIEHERVAKTGETVARSIYNFNVEMQHMPAKKIFLLKIFGYAKIFSNGSNRIFKFTDFYKRLSGFLKDGEINILSVKKTGVFVLRDNGMYDPFEIIKQV